MTNREREWLRGKISDLQKRRLTRGHAMETNVERARRYFEEGVKRESAEHTPWTRPHKTGRKHGSF